MKLFYITFVLFRAIECVSNTTPEQKFPKNKNKSVHLQIGTSAHDENIKFENNKLAIPRVIRKILEAVAIEGWDDNSMKEKINLVAAGTDS